MIFVQYRNWTRFIKISHMISVLGAAALFYNILPDGNADVRSLHAALPVHRGEKWLANFWIRDTTNGPKLTLDDLKVMGAEPKKEL